LETNLSNLYVKKNSSFSLWEKARMREAVNHNIPLPPTLSQKERE